MPLTMVERGFQDGKISDFIFYRDLNASVLQLSPLIREQIPTVNCMVASSVSCLDPAPNAPTGSSACPRHSF